MEKKRVRVLISGIVQGVAYRAHTKEMAKRLGVNGWVRNLPDGKVEALFEGDKDKVDQMVEWCKKGPPLARVDKVEVEEEPYRGEFFDFSIRY
jgi:acylphosphatase